MNTLDEAAAKDLLAGYGIPVVQEARAADAQQAVAAAERIGYPVVLKGIGAEFAHKTELGLVVLNLRDPQAVRAAAGRLLDTLAGRGELLVQRMVAGRREFLAGLSRDPQFGPVVTFGLGGIFAEALADVSFRVCPLSDADAREMLDEIRGKALLGALRGLPAVDREVLVRTLAGLSRLAIERPDIAAVDINPLVVDGSQPVAVDALVVMG
ncbi:MAG TPA: acetate--CoA ligase family protein [Ramlibacter sp.]|nr:acetate--CoA ligase family protein [Ramlibacter sp.]